jgi:Zn-dependent protease
MLRSWKIGRFCGIEVFVHWTFFLLPLYVFLMTASRGVPVALFFVAGVLLLFGCVVLHEFGHALTARRFGIPTRDITMYPIGGVARMERMSEKPWEEFWIAIAGPMVNVVIALLIRTGFTLAGVTNLQERFQAIGTVSPQMFTYGVGNQLLLWLMVMNIGLVIFNMIPAFPMDGGRVLRAGLTMLMGHLRATEVAAGLGMVIAWLLALAGLGFFQPHFSGSGMLVIVALFVFVAGQQELAVLRHRAAQAEAALLNRPVEWFYTLDPQTRPPEPGYTGYSWDGRARIWIEWRDGRPVQGSFME